MRCQLYCYTAYTRMAERTHAIVWHLNCPWSCEKTPGPGASMLSVFQQSLGFSKFGVMPTDWI